MPRYWVPEEEVIVRLEQAKPSQAKPSQAKPSQAKPSQAKPSQAKPSPQLYSTHSNEQPTIRFQANHERYQRKNERPLCDSDRGFRSFRSNSHPWLAVIRDIAGPTNQRTAILSVIRATAVSNKAPLLEFQYHGWLQVLRGITNSTNERTVLATNLDEGGVGNSAPFVEFENARAIASALVLANMNSLPLDWAARLSVGGVNMNFFIIKQLPVLPPESYLEASICGQKYVELVVPRVLELSYTSVDLAGFANDLGYDGPPFDWDEERRHRLKSELDAIFAHMYALERSDLAWILDAEYPSASFPSLKENELQRFGEYRTERLVLEAYDLIRRGKLPDLQSELKP